MLNKSLLISVLCGVSIQASAEGWSGQGEAGLVKASGNTDSENFNIGLKFTKESDLWNHELGISLYQASNDNIDSADSLAVDYTAKRDLSERRYLFAGLGYLDDDFDGFTEQSSASFGYGYRAIISEPVTWELGVGIGYRDTSQLQTLASGIQVEGEDVSGATLVLRSDYAHQLTANTQFLDNFKADIGSDNTFIENDAALVVSMNEKFSLKAGLLVRHNTDPALGADDTDTITSLNLLYNF